MLLERRMAMAAVGEAVKVCQRVRGGIVGEVQKRDKSPVTVADYASQAVICKMVREAFPTDAIVAEEDSTELPDEVREIVLEQVGASLGRSVGENEVMGWIDAGRWQEAVRKRSGRFWTLDPIDGTKGFLRGGQYAVALALAEEGRVVLGVLGCPNLGGEGGVMLVAERGKGAAECAISRVGSTVETPLRMPEIGSNESRWQEKARFCESVEGGHTDQGRSVRIAEKLGIRAEPVRMDSQAKYAAVARGDAEIYLRLPTSGEYREKIWDHAAGAIIVEEAGGRVTDILGRELDFGEPPVLRAGGGVVATRGVDHGRVVWAVSC